MRNHNALSESEYPIDHVAAYDNEHGCVKERIYYSNNEFARLAIAQYIPVIGFLVLN